MRKLLVLSIIALLLSCEKLSVNTIKISDDKIEQVLLSKRSSVKLVSIKSEEPMEDLMTSESLGFGDYLFLISYSRTKLYCVKGDKVVSVLNHRGRGPGEYTDILSYAFSESDTTLYVCSSDYKLLKYKGFDFKSAGQCKTNIKFSTIRVIDKDKLFVRYYDLANSNIGIAIISSKTGEIIEKLLDFDYSSSYWGYSRDYYQKGDEIIFPVNSDYSFSICQYSDGRMDTIQQFEYNKQWQIPQSVIVTDVSDLNQLLSYTQYILGNNNRCIGGYYPIVNGRSITFWSFPFKNETVTCIKNVYNGVSVKRNVYKIPGIIDNFVSPSFVWNNKFVNVFQGTKESVIDESTKMSPLGQEIIDMIDSQDGNPILMLFD